MSTTINFTSSELTSIGSSVAKELRQLAVAAGYTNPQVVLNPDGSADVKVDESAVAKATMQTNLTNASIPTISVVETTLDVTADGVATGTINIDGPANAVVNVSWPGVLPISDRQVTLNGTGDGSITVGPFSSGTCTCAGGFRVKFSLDDDPSVSCDTKVTATPA